MATKKYWYHYVTEIMLGLVLIGVITVSDLPTYYCDKEDTIRSCLYLKDNNQTCVYAFQSEGDTEYESAGDRCQKGYTRGIWELTDNFIRIPTDLSGEITEVERPIIMYNAKVTKDLDNVQYIEGYCTSTLEIK